MALAAAAPGGRMIRWVFLDIGNVLWDEDPLTYFSFRRHVEAVRAVRPDLTFDALLAAREAKALAGSRWPVHEVTSAILNERRCVELWEETSRDARARFTALSPPIAGAIELIRGLAGRFRLGLIANQPRQCRGRLAELGLLECFEVTALAEEEGVFKPDPALFARALDRARALPAECLMVGDRLDDDVTPAAAIGMATAWVRWPDRLAKGWMPDDPDAHSYVRSLGRVARAVAARVGGVVPAITVDETRELAAAIDGYARVPNVS